MLDRVGFLEVCTSLCFSHPFQRLKIKNGEEKAIIWLFRNHSFQLLHWVISGVVKY